MSKTLVEPDGGADTHCSENAMLWFLGNFFLCIRMRRGQSLGFLISLPLQWPHSPSASGAAAVLLHRCAVTVGSQIQWRKALRVTIFNWHLWRAGCGPFCHCIAFDSHSWKYFFLNMPWRLVGSACICVYQMRRNKTWERERECCNSSPQWQLCESNDYVVASQMYFPPPFN